MVRQAADAYIVTPLAGVWIEIHISCLIVIVKPVTPLAGVWIEILALRLSRLT